MFRYETPPPSVRPDLRGQAPLVRPHRRAGPPLTCPEVLAVAKGAALSLKERRV